MTTRPWYAFYPSDYTRDTRDLDWVQHAAYRFLLDAAWERDTCSLPNDLVRIRRLLPPVDLRVFKRVVPPLLERFFYLNAAGEWVNKRLLKERQHLNNASLKGKQNSEKRWKNNDPSMPSHMPLTLTPTKKEHGANAPRGDPERAALYARAKEVTGDVHFGGQVTKLLARMGSISKARAIIENAADAGDPKAYIGAVIRGRLPTNEQDQDQLLLAWCRKNGVSGCDALEIPAILEDMNGGQPYRRKANGNHT